MNKLALEKSVDKWHCYRRPDTYFKTCWGILNKRNGWIVGRTDHDYELETCYYSIPRNQDYWEVETLPIPLNWDTPL